MASATNEHKSSSKASHNGFAVEFATLARSIFEDVFVFSSSSSSFFDRLPGQREVCISLDGVEREVEDRNSSKHLREPWTFRVWHEGASFFLPHKSAQSDVERTLTLARVSPGLHLWLLLLLLLESTRAYFSIDGRQSWGVVLTTPRERERLPLSRLVSRRRCHWRPPGPVQLDWLDWMQNWSQCWPVSWPVPIPSAQDADRATRAEKRTKSWEDQVSHAVILSQLTGELVIANDDKNLYL